MAGRNESGGGKMTGFELWSEINDSLQEIEYAADYMGIPDKAKCLIK